MNNLEKSWIASEKVWLCCGFKCLTLLILYIQWNPFWKIEKVECEGLKSVEERLRNFGDLKSERLSFGQQNVRILQ